MSIIRVSHAKNYTCISNQAIRDKALSFKARGLHHLLLSYPDGWRIRIDTLLRESDKDGKKAVAAGLKELEKAGYLTRTKVRDPNTGKLDWESVIRELPITPFGEDGANQQTFDSQTDTEDATIPPFPSAGLPSDGLPSDGSPSDGNGVHIVSTDLVSTEERNTQPTHTVSLPAQQPRRERKVAVKKNKEVEPALREWLYQKAIRLPERPQFIEQWIEVQASRKSVQQEFRASQNTSPIASQLNQQQNTQTSPGSLEGINLPPLLQPLKNLGVNLEDGKLQQAIATFPERVPTAIAVLTEKPNGTVRTPTRFLEQAIRGNWQPEKPEKQHHAAFNGWFDAARQHQCGVAAAELREGIQWVFNQEGGRFRWDDLRSLNWDDLREHLRPISLPPLGTEPLDLSETLAAIDCEMVRLRWTGDRLKHLLQATYGKPKRALLSEEELIHLLHLLQAEEAG